MHQFLCSSLESNPGKSCGEIGGVKSIYGPYVDRLSITIGSNRKHVWTYAVGLSGNFSFPEEN